MRDEEKSIDPDRPASRVVALILILVSSVVSLLLAEAALRLVWTNPFANESTDYLLEIERHHPFRDLSVDRAALYPEDPISRLRTDERSYILPSVRFQDPDATIVFLGGSTTETVVVSEELRFPALVSTLLEERGRRVNTLNAGKSGLSTQDSLNLLLNHIVYDEPDIAVMMHAANDIGWLAQRGDLRARRAGPLNLGTVFRWLGQVASIHSSVGGALRWAQLKWTTAPSTWIGGEARLARESKPLDHEKYVARLRAFVGICRAFGILPVLMTQPVAWMNTPLTPDWLDPGNQDLFNGLIRQVGAEEGVLVIDLVEYISVREPRWRVPMVVFYDGMHLTEFGSRLVADHIAERLYEVIPQSRTAGAPADSGAIEPE